MTLPIVSGAQTLATPTPTPAPAQPQLSAAQAGDVAGGRAAVVEGQVVPIDRGGASATAASAQTWGSSPQGSPQRLAFDQTAQRLGTTDPVKIAGDISRQLGVGQSNAATPPSSPTAPAATNATGPPAPAPANAASPSGAAPTSAPNALSGGNTPNAIAPAGNPAGATQSGLSGTVAGTVGSVTAALQSLAGAASNPAAATAWPATPGWARAAGMAGVPVGGTVPPGTPANPLGSLGTLGGRAVDPALAQVQQTLGTVAGTARGAVGAAAGGIATATTAWSGGAPTAPQALPGGLAGVGTPLGSVGREGTAGTLTLARGEGALGGSALATGARAADGSLLNPLGIPREGLLAALGAFALPVTGERGVPGGIAPSAGRALAQEALLARMASMFAPNGQGARGGEPGTWMGLAAALAARAAEGETAAAAQSRALAEGAADAARLNGRQPDGAPAFGANPALRTDEQLHDEAAVGYGLDDAPFTCRCDSRPPEVIFATGFEATPATGDVVAGAAVALPLAAPLANAAAQEIARLGHADPVTLRRVGGIDVDRVLGVDDGFAHEIATAVPAAAPRTVRALHLGGQA